MNHKKIQSLFLIILSVFLLNSQAFSQRTKSSLSAGEQRKAEKGLKDNRYFFFFIDSSLTNFGTEEDKNRFKEAIQRDIIGRILLMKFQFRDSFIEIRRSQRILIDLYRIVVARDIALGKTLMNNLAPEVIHSKEPMARKYLQLGYRSLAHSRQFMIMADHYRESLYSYRLYKYVRAIKKAKEGRRYGFLAILAATKGPEFNPDKEKYDFKKVQALIPELPEITDEKKEYYYKIHHDNFYNPYGRASYFNTIWEDPHLNDIPEYGEYFRATR